MVMGGGNSREEGVVDAAGYGHAEQKFEVNADADEGFGKIKR